MRRRGDLFRWLVENSPDGILVLDAQGKAQFQSRSCYRLLGYSGTKMSPDVFRLLHPDDVGRVSDGFKHLIGTPSSGLGIDLRLRDRSKSWRSFRAHAQNLLHHPAVMGIVIRLHDIDRQTQTGVESGSPEAKWQALMASAPQFVCSLAADGTILWANRTIAGHPGEPVAGTCCYDYFTPGDRRRVRGLVEQAFRFGEPQQYELRTSICGVGSLWLHVNVAPVRDSGRVVEAIYLASDISYQKRYEEQLVAHNERLRQANSNMTTSFAGFASRAMPPLLQEVRRRVGLLRSYETNGPIVDTSEHWHVIETALDECQVLTDRVLALCQSSAETGERLSKPARGESVPLGDLRETSLPAGLEQQDHQRLSARERSVLEMLADGLDNTEIGRRLGIKEGTVRTYILRTLDKLQLASRREAVVYAARMRAREATHED